MIKDTNPDHYKVDGANFIEYMNDPKISGFGNWMFANGYNSGVWAATNWISVKDDMPKDSKPVYVWLGRGSVLRGGIPFVGRYDPFREGVWQIWGLDGDKSEIIKVTHWMPIEPPEEDV